jgi:hypothetical protein
MVIEAAHQREGIHDGRGFFLDEPGGIELPVAATGVNQGRPYDITGPSRQSAVPSGSVSAADG